MVRMSRKEDIFDCLSTKEDIFDNFPVDNEDIIEGGVSEATVMEIDDLRNECVTETEDDLNRRLLQNKEESYGPFTSCFGNLLAIMEISHIIAHCSIVLRRPHSRK